MAEHKIMHAAGPFREKALAWFRENVSDATVTTVYVKGDGYLCFQWEDGASPYHVPIETVLVAAAEERGRQGMIQWMINSAESDFQRDCPFDGPREDQPSVDEPCQVCGEDSDGNGGTSPCVDTSRGRLITKLLALKATPSPSRQETLFEAIKHGDQQHQDWLKQAIDDHFAGRPVERPQGKGTKEAARDQALREAMAAQCTGCKASWEYDGKYHRPPNGDLESWFECEAKGVRALLEGQGK